MPKIFGSLLEKFLSAQLFVDAPGVPEAFLGEI